MLRTRHKREFKAEINIVPLLDVLLVLLLTFMVTSPIISQNLKVQLPNIPQLGILSDNHPNNLPIILEVSRIGKYTVIINGDRKKILSLNQIEAITKDALAKNSQTIFLIGGAKDIPYEEVIKVLNTLYQAGIKSVGFMTNPI
ncbi:MAG: colicin uptake protein TolR [Arsenophonus sp.]